MAITNIEVITAALRDIGVISEIDTPSAEQGSHALAKMNRMIESWTENGIELGYYPQESLTEDCPIPAKSELAVIAILATQLAPTYGATVSNELAVLATNAYQTLLRNTVRDAMKPADMSHLPMGDGHGGWTDVFNE